MLLYRISQTKYANSLTASGIDGRWNSLNQKMIYTAGSVALACLENLAHKSGASLAAGNFSLAIIEVEDDLKIEEVRSEDLASAHLNWNSVDQYPLTQKLGDDWLNANTAAILKVPSAIIDLEYNYLINPNHASFTGIKIVKVDRFRFDDRLKGNL
ncbi:RES family NAD+ phosphorylase [Mucilaginibacter arboris]|uniref:RES domain-containing protein n=1 Tax=Mucilaginibacter arboris TaxID=2682090 RepID=A0A7K1STF7_9SPHI|nr:RES family NAD+ phosphorylase [Mucilaginibacter arboris]MVN20390.1 RES domain-containing protein [Mucilaginibacter arboris]